MINNIKKILRLDTNIFKSALFQLTLTYLAIIMAVVSIFNIVIYNSLNIPEINDNKTTNTYSHEIIEISSKKTRDNILQALFILDTSILIAGFWGSWTLAKKTLLPIEEAHRLQSEFVSNASHEMRNPLASMQLEIELALADKNANKNELRDTLRSNLEEVKSLTSLINTLLKLSNINSHIELEKINLNETITNRISKYKQDIKMSSTKNFTIYGNKDILEELLSILIDNALKYRAGKEKIEVKTFRYNRKAILEVSNYSSKIAPSELEKLFDRFYRLDDARSCNGKCQGYGLGLAIAKKISEASGFQISAQNIKESPNKYKTTFTIKMPFYKE